MSINDNVSRALILFAMIVAFVQCASTASAGPINDIPTALGDALEVSDSVAGMIISAAVMASLAMTLAVAKVDTAVIFVTEVPICVLLIIFEWMPYWILILICLIIAGMFGKRTADWFSGFSMGGG